VLDGGSEVIREILVKIIYGAANLTHEVVMSRLVHPMVPETPAAEMGDRDEAKVTQGVERAIDGGDIDKRVARAHLCEDFLGADVAVALLEGVENEQSLRREAQPGILQALRQSVVIVSHSHHLL
jgi:hypothetical protein